MRVQAWCTSFARKERIRSISLASPASSVYCRNAQHDAIPASAISTPFGYIVSLDQRSPIMTKASEVALFTELHLQTSHSSSTRPGPYRAAVVHQQVQGVENASIREHFFLSAKQKALGRGCAMPPAPAYFYVYLVPRNTPKKKRRGS